MTKTEIASVLEDVAALLELKGENPFKICAYTNAARSLETFGGNLPNLQDEEALANIRKHACTTRAHLALERQGATVRLEVQDWGCGFDPLAVLHEARPGEHVGLHLMNGTEYLEGMIACFKIRAIPINVNFRYVEAEQLVKDLSPMTANMRGTIFANSAANSVVCCAIVKDAPM